MTILHRVLACAVVMAVGVAGCGSSRSRGGDVNEVARLAGLLKADSASVKISALRDLALKRPESIVATADVVALLADREPKVRWTAAETLGAFGPPAAELALAPLSAATKDQDAAVRLRAVEALRKLGTRALDAATELTAALNDSQWFVRAAAAEAVGTLGPPARQAVPALIPLLTDVDPQVRPRAAWALGRMGEDAAPAAGDLAAVLAKGDPALRELAARALRCIGPAAFGPAARIIADERAEVRIAALQVMETAGDMLATAGGDFERRLGSSDATVRRDAAREIAAMLQWSQPAVQAVLDGVKDPRAAVSQRAIELAGRFGPSLAALSRAIASAFAGDGELTSCGVRASAASADIVTALSAKLTDPAPSVRRAAATALGQVGPFAAPAEAALVAAAAGDPDNTVRDAAAWALRRLRPK